MLFLGLIEKNAYDGLQGTAEILSSTLLLEAEKITGTEDMIARRKNVLQQSISTNSERILI